MVRSNRANQFLVVKIALIYTLQNQTKFNKLEDKIASTIELYDVE